MFRIIL